MGSIKQTSSGLKYLTLRTKLLLIVDDDDSFRNRLSRAMEKKGFEVKDAKTL
jgi:ActR/RegA family two-component response regulator